MKDAELTPGRGHPPTPGDEESWERGQAGAASRLAGRPSRIVQADFVKPHKCMLVKSSP